MIILAFFTISLAVHIVEPSASNNLQAGISAWVVTASFAQADILPLYQTIEYRTQDVLIGSVLIPGYGHDESVHLYSHTSGYLLAFYPRHFGISHLFDFQNGIDGTKLEHGLRMASSAVGAPISQETYYHFQYPNANTLFLTVQNGTGTTTVSLPLDLQYYEFGIAFSSNTCCACYPRTANLYLDGTLIAGMACGVQSNYQAVDLAPGFDHDLHLVIDGGLGYGGLAMIYGGEPITTTVGYTMALNNNLAAHLRDLPPYVSAHAASVGQASPMAKPPFDLPIFYDLFFPVMHYER
jgi:hypothetical protein